MRCFPILIILLLSGFSCKTGVPEGLNHKPGKIIYSDLVLSELETSVKNSSIIELWSQGAGTIPNSGVSVNFINRSVLSLSLSPTSIPDFSLQLADKISGSANTTSLLHLAHQLNSLSAGGYGPPVGSGQINDGSDIVTGSIAEASELLINSDPALNNYILSLLSLIQRTATIFSGFSDNPSLLKSPHPEQPAQLMPDPSDYIFPFQHGEIIATKYKRLFESFDLQAGAYSSRILTEGVNKLTDAYLNERDTINNPAENIIFGTVYGNAAICTSGSDTLSGDFFLIIDLGGNDYYDCNVAVSGGVQRPVSICIDLGGDDVYGNIDGSSGICSSVAGLSMLVDCGGDDTYNASSFSLAFTAAGSAILDDREGDDIYRATGDYSLASAFFGYALINDSKGDDEYYSRSFSLGFGGTGGIAIVRDKEGTDSYFSAGESFVQGSAKGRWADATDGYNLGGGFGILVDCMGNDKYSSGYFSQGASYYNAMGIMVDLGGDDGFDSEMHSQGAAVHTSLACFADRSGSDRYNLYADSSKLTQSVGYGRDNSYAFFIDESGDDHYSFGNKSFGVGDINATGIAIDCRGNDTYKWHNNNIYSGFSSYGSAQETSPGMKIDKPLLPRPEQPCLGMALDLSGKDNYFKITEEASISVSKEIINSITLNNNMISVSKRVR